MQSTLTPSPRRPKFRPFGLFFIAVVRLPLLFCTGASAFLGGFRTSFAMKFRADCPFALYFGHHLPSYEAQLALIYWQLSTSFKIS